MWIDVVCQCGKRYRVDGKWAGKSLRCKGCSAEVLVEHPQKSPGETGVMTGLAGMQEPIPPALQNSPEPEKKKWKFTPAMIGWGVAAVVGTVLIVLLWTVVSMIGGAISHWHWNSPRHAENNSTPDTPSRLAGDSPTALPPPAPAANETPRIPRREELAGPMEVLTTQAARLRPASAPWWVDPDHIILAARTEELAVGEKVIVRPRKNGWYTFVRTTRDEGTGPFVALLRKAAEGENPDGAIEVFDLSKQDKGQLTPAAKLGEIQQLPGTEQVWLAPNAQYVVARLTATALLEPKRWTAWSTRTGQRMSFAGHELTLPALGPIAGFLTPRTILIGGHIYDLDTGQPTEPTSTDFDQAANHALVQVLSANAQYVAIFDLANLSLWHAGTWEKLGQVPCPTQLLHWADKPLTPLGAAFSPDGQWLAASFGYGKGRAYWIAIWDATTGQLLRQIRTLPVDDHVPNYARIAGLDDAQNSPVWSGDSQALALAGGLYNLAGDYLGSPTGPPETPNAQIIDAPGMPGFLAAYPLNPDQLVFAGSGTWAEFGAGGQRVREWIAPVHLRGTMASQTLAINNANIAIEDNAHFRLQLWDPHTLALSTDLELPENNQIDTAGPARLGPPIAFNADGTQLAAALQNHTLTSLDPATGKATALDQFGPYGKFLGFSSDGKHAAIRPESPDDSTVVLRELHTGKEIGKIDEATGVKVLALSPDATSVLLLAKEPLTAMVWDPATAKSRFILDALRTNLDRAEWSPDGSLIAASVAGGEGTVRVPPRPTPGAKPPAPAPAATTTWHEEPRLTIWDAKGRVEAVLKGHTWKMLRFSNDSKLLAALRSDGECFVFDPHVLRVNGHLVDRPRLTLVQELSFTPDAKHLVIATDNGGIFVYGLGTP